MRATPFQGVSGGGGELGPDLSHSEGSCTVRGGRTLRE